MDRNPGRVQTDLHKARGGVLGTGRGREKDAQVAKDVNTVLRTHGNFQCRGRGPHIPTFSALLGGT